jgi:hypothetical protein
MTTGPGRAGRRLVAPLVTITVLAMACSDDPAGQATPSGDPSPSSSPSSSLPESPPAPSGDLVQATRLEDVAAGSPLAPGRYAMEPAGERADTPLVLIDVPAGYEAGGDWAEIGSEGDSPFRHFDAWTVAEVATDACGQVDWVDPGPSVGDLADALASLPVWETTPPVARTIDGHEGVYMELNVPAEIPGACHDNLLSWRDHRNGTAGIGSGKTQRLWIADVDGHRLMLMAGYFPGPDGPTPEQVDEITQMAEGAMFVGADEVAP